ncbi:MAG: ATP-binding cassette domain-containing protein [Ignavibacteriales bacterium]|nr:ATP-binding cassette domain-containing protein [Ignavibacteriales bacterium]
MGTSQIIIEANIDFVELKLNGTSKVLFRNVNFKLEENSIYTLLGNNGVGKTTFLNTLLNLLDLKFYRVEGKINLLGCDLLNSSAEELQFLRKNSVRFIFQDAVNCFDPLKKIGYYFDQLKFESGILDELLDYFLLPPKEIILNYYPYELSGGIAQRIALIWGIISKPKLLIIDEPNSALDQPLSVLLSKKLAEISILNDLSILVVTQDLKFAFSTGGKIGLLKPDGIEEYDNDDESLNRLKINLLK